MRKNKIKLPSFFQKKKQKKKKNKKKKTKKLKKRNTFLCVFVNFFCWMDLNQLKTSFINGLINNRKLLRPFFKESTELTNKQIKKVKSASTFQDVCQSIFVYNFVRELGYSQNVPTNIQPFQLIKDTNFEQNTYFISTLILSGGSLLHNFTLSLSCCSINPMDKLSVWYISGGFTSKNQWVSIPNIWLENVEYEEWSTNLFLLRSMNENENKLNFRLGTPNIGQFRIALSFDDDNQQNHQLTAWFTNKSLPQFINNNAYTNWHRQLNFIFTDMSLELSVDQNIPSTGLGFVQKTNLLSPPSSFWKQFLFISKQLKTKYEPILYIFGQFQELQFLIVTPLTYIIYQGLIIRNFKEVKSYSYGKEIQHSLTELTITSTTLINGKVYPTGFDLLIDSKIAIVATTNTNSFGLNLNMSSQADYTCLLNLTDTTNNFGICKLSINNVLNSNQWSELVFQNQDDLLINQPLIHKKALVATQLFFVLLCVAILLILILVPIFLSHKN